MYEQNVQSCLPVYECIQYSDDDLGLSVPLAISKSIFQSLKLFTIQSFMLNTQCDRPTLDSFCFKANFSDAGVGG